MIGFVRSLAERRIPGLQKPPTLEGIYNYRSIEGLFPTSGQPSEAELQCIVDAGYRTVINLAPRSVLENSVINEAEILAGAGVHYVHIPVDFKAPTDEDFNQFTEAVKQAGHDKLWVHCAANMRVSAFVYRYRVEQLGHEASAARHDLEQIWQPFGVWTAFLRR